MESHKSKPTFIVAMDKNGLIGKEGRLPWHNPDDLQWFYSYIRGKTPLVGSKTWATLPPKLKRISHVINREGLPNVKNPVIIGGATIYKEYMHLCSYGFVTIIDGEYEGDTYLDIKCQVLGRWFINDKDYVMVVKPIKNT